MQGNVDPPRGSEAISRRFGSLNRQGVAMRFDELDRHQPWAGALVRAEEHEDLSVDLGDSLSPREVLRGVGQRQRERP